MTQSDIWEKFKEGLKKVSTAAADFTEEQAIIGKLKFEILSLKRKVDRLHNDLGIRLKEMARQDPKANPLADDEIKDMLARIEDLEARIRQKRSEITEVADQMRAKRGEPAAEKEEEERGASGPDDEPAATTRKKPSPSGTKAEPSARTRKSTTRSKRPPKKAAPEGTDEPPDTNEPSGR